MDARLNIVLATLLALPTFQSLSAADLPRQGTTQPTAAVAWTPEIEVENFGFILPASFVKSQDKRVGGSRYIVFKSDKQSDRTGALVVYKVDKALVRSLTSGTLNQLVIRDMLDKAGVRYRSLDTSSSQSQVRGASCSFCVHTPDKLSARGIARCLTRRSYRMTVLALNAPAEGGEGLRRVVASLHAHSD